MVVEGQVVRAGNRGDLGLIETAEVGVGFIRVAADQEEVPGEGLAGVVIIKDSIITTTGDGSGGTMTTGGGITNASNLTVTTNGQSSAAIRTDRGGGTVYVDGGTYTSNGLGSPAIYSTAEIHVANAALISNLSEGVCIEGLDSIDRLERGEGARHELLAD